MKRRKTSLFTALVLALSLTLSPVSAFADELDTPVHEDPIDEVVYDSGWIGGHFERDAGGRRAEFDVSVYCTFHWTDGDNAWIDSALYVVSHILVNGGDGYVSYSTPVDYFSHNAGCKALKVFNFSRSGYSTVVVAVAVYCDEYGELSINAYIP